MSNLPNGFKELRPDQQPGVAPASKLGVGPVPPVVPPFVKPPAVKPVKKPDVTLTHKVFPSGNHELTLSIPNKAIQSGQCGPNEIAKCVDPRTKKVYCAVTDFYKGSLPEAFIAEPVAVQHIKAN